MPFSEEQLNEEAARLIEEWLTTGLAKLSGAERVVALDADGMLRLAMDLMKRAPKRRQMSFQPDAIRPKKTATEEKP